MEKEFIGTLNPVQDLRAYLKCTCTDYDNSIKIKSVMKRDAHYAGELGLRFASVLIEEVTISKTEYDKIKFEK